MLYNLTDYVTGIISLSAGAVCPCLEHTHISPHYGTSWQTFIRHKYCKPSAVLCRKMCENDHTVCKASVCFKTTDGS